MAAPPPPDNSGTGSHPDLQQQPHSNNNESVLPCQCDNNSIINNNYHWSLSLRSPLGEDAPYLLASQPNAPPHVSVVAAQQHNAKLRPMLCALLVACRILRVSVETQFTAACLMHRYYYWAHDNDSNEEQAPTPAVSQSVTTTTVPQHADTKWVFSACLFLACKSEEEPRRLRDVINCAHMITWESIPQPAIAGQRGEDEDHRPASKKRNDSASLAETETPVSNKRLKMGANRASTCDNHIVSLFWNPHPPNLDDGDDDDDKHLDNPQAQPTHHDATKPPSPPTATTTSAQKIPAATSSSTSSYYWDAKASIIETEKLVLRWLAFDVSVSHPHRAIVWIAQDLQKNTAAQSSLATTILASPLSSLPSSFVSQLVVAAWKRLNNAVFSILALRHAVLPLACAAVQLATAHVDLETNNPVGDDNNPQQIKQQQKHSSSSSSTSEAADVPKKFSFICLEQEWSRRFGVDPESLFMAVRDLENSLL